MCRWQEEDIRVYHRNTQVEVNEIKRHVEGSTGTSQSLKCRVTWQNVTQHNTKYVVTWNQDVAQE